MHNIKNQTNKSSVKNLKILIAEDDEVSNFLLTYLLKEKNPEFFRAKTGIEAINICNKNPDIDIILMDINMPDMNGYEATRQIRKFNKETVIIAQTSKTSTEDTQQAMAAGCNEFLIKPITKQSLFSAISQYFK